MQTSLEFFQEHFGSKIDPALAPLEVLMKPYPHINPAKTSTPRMGTSDPARFLVARGVAKLWAPVRLPDHTQGRIDVAPTSARGRRDWIVDVIMNPPEPPFLVAALGMAASDTSYWRITVSKEMIVFGGNASLFDGSNSLEVDRRKFLEARDWFKATAVPVSDLLRRRDIAFKFKRKLITGEAAKRASAKIKTPAALLDAYPGADHPFLMKLAAYAASEWVQQ